MVILAVQKNCAYCEENWPSWLELQHGLKDIADFETVDVRSTLTAEDAAARGVDSAQILQMQRNEIKRMHLSQTPTALVVNQTGAIVKSWLGVLSEARVNEFKSVVRNITQRR
jgi:hypothetical protein